MTTCWQFIQGGQNQSNIVKKYIRKVDAVRAFSWRSVCSVTLMCDMPPCYRSRDTNAVTQIFQTRVSHYSNYCHPYKHRLHSFKGKVILLQLSYNLDDKNWVSGDLLVLVNVWQLIQGSLCYMEEWLIPGRKNPAYGRHPISRPMLIVAPIPQ